METFDRLRRSVKPYHVLLLGAGALVCTLLLFGADVALRQKMVQRRLSMQEQAWGATSTRSSMI